MTSLGNAILSLTCAALTASGLDAQTPPPKPCDPVPDARHLRWQDRTYYAFVHFNMNTFTGEEWGDGRENPGRFAPTALDCEQWARVCKAAGMTGIVLTAKHHDGFCLWPTTTTEHHVGKSPFRDGKGDVLSELSAACRKHGLAMGLYLSPWDRNHPTYGESDRYNAVFRQQLEEILTGYGSLFEVWFDGACGEGPTGKRQVYDWPSFIEVVRRNQPGAVIFSDAGPDIRWVGNERGFASPTNWAPMERDRFVPGDPKYRELGEGHENGTHWVPAECDVSIRPGWYYRKSEDDKVKSVAELEEIWYGSVGRNANLLLNLPVDRRGLVHETDTARLMGLRAVLDATFAVDHAQGATATADNVRGEDREYRADHVVDQDDETYWAADDGVTQANLTLDLAHPTVIDRIWLAEHVPLGQRIQEFEVHCRAEDDTWTLATKGTTVGFRRILRFPAMRTSGVQVRILRARACPTLTHISLHTSPPRVALTATAREFTDSTVVVAECDREGATLRYTLDGSEPAATSPPFDGKLVVARTASLRVRAFTGEMGGPSARLELRRFAAEDLWPSVEGDLSGAPGLRYAYFERQLEQLQDSTPWGQPIETGSVNGFARTPARRADAYALRFDGTLAVPQNGVYQFSLESDDGSRLYIDGRLVVDNDGLHGMIRAHGSAPLQAGHHEIRVEYFNRAGGAGLEVDWRIPGTTEPVPIPTSVLRRSVTTALR